MSLIKICGLRREEDILMVNRYKPDFAGFILVPGRTRNVEIDTLNKLYDMLDHSIKAVGVFYDSSLERIASIADRGIIDIIQLHGHETEEDVAWLKNRFNLPVIKAVSVKTFKDIEAWQNSTCDYLLLDNGNGGTGESFDWNQIGNISKPFFIAGGINSDNITRAMSYNPYGIDVSGGVETDGFKDENKIKHIIDLARRKL